MLDKFTVTSYFQYKKTELLFLKVFLFFTNDILCLTLYFCYLCHISKDSMPVILFAA